MPSRGTRHVKEIERLRGQGLSDAKIAEKLSIGRSIVTRALSKGRSKHRLAQLMMEAGLLSLKQVLASAEVSWRWIELERMRLLEGKSSLTAADLGTIARNQERALQMAKAFLGKAFSPEDLAAAERQSDTIRKAREHLRTLEAQGVAVDEP